MRGAVTALVMLACATAVRAQPAQHPELAVQLLRCSVLYLVISNIRGEQYQQGKSPNSFLSKGMAFQGMAIALTNSEFASSELEVIGKTLDGRSASEAVALLNDVSPECAEIPVAHAKRIADGLKRLKSRKSGGQHEMNDNLPAIRKFQRTPLAPAELHRQALHPSTREQTQLKNSSANIKKI